VGGHRDRSGPNDRSNSHSIREGDFHWPTIAHLHGAVRSQRSRSRPPGKRICRLSRTALFRGEASPVSPRAHERCERWIWARRYPQEVPIVNDEIEWIALEGDD